MKISKEDKMVICQRYLNGENQKPLADEYGVTMGSIKSLLKIRGIKIRKFKHDGSKKYSYNENYFDIVDTEDKAYFLGLLYADGCNHEKEGKVTIGLQEEDKDILDKFKMAINSSKPLSFLECYRYGVRCKNKYILIMCGRYICNSLKNLGCEARKSLTLKFPTYKQVPKQLLSHFIRGMVDGDGSILFHKTKTADRCRVQIVSTKKFLTSLVKKIKQELGIKPQLHKHSENNNITYKLIIQDHLGIMKFLNWIYYNSTIYLNRKFDKYLHFLKIWNNQREIIDWRYKKMYKAWDEFKTIYGKINSFTLAA